MFKMKNKVTKEVKVFSSIDNLDKRLWEKIRSEKNPVGKIRLAILTPAGIIPAVKEVWQLTELSNHAVMSDNSFLSTIF